MANIRHVPRVVEVAKLDGGVLDDFAWLSLGGLGRHFNGRRRWPGVAGKSARDLAYNLVSVHIANHNNEDVAELENVATLMPSMFLDIQNRRQLTAGITSFKPDRTLRLKTFKNVG